jgi:hypothetical protein
MTPLRQRMLEDMQVRNLSPLAQRAYLEHVSHFARHFGGRPAQLGLEEIQAYQVHLATDKQLAPASIVITVAALRSCTPSRSRRRGLGTTSQLQGLRIALV